MLDSIRNKLRKFVVCCKARLDFNVKGFALLALLIYGSFIIGDWFTNLIGLSQYGLLGTFVALIVPVIIVYFLWKTKTAQQHIK